MTDDRTAEESSETPETVDLWVAGTEEPQFSPTDEGSQEITSDDSVAKLDEEFGRVVDDDYVFDDDIADVIPMQPHASSSPRMHASNWPRPPPGEHSSWGPRTRGSL